MKTIGIGLIGCGERIRTLMGALLTGRDGLEITAICDPSDKAVGRARQTFAKNARVYADYHDLVADAAVDWVLVGSWNCFHAQHVTAAFHAHKHVFCEKPLATTLDDCLAMRDAWLAAEKTFVIGYTLRYSPLYRKIRQLIHGGAIGDLISLEFNETLPFGHGGWIHADWRRHSRNAGTHLLEKCSHDVDLVNWYVGALASRVASFGGCDYFVPKNAWHVQRIGPAPDGKQPYGDWWEVMGYAKPPADCFGTDKDIVDNQVAIIEYANRVRATFHTNLHSGLPERRMYICGTEGAIRADSTAGTLQLGRIAWGAPVESIPFNNAGEHAGGDAILAAELAATMLEGAPPVVSMEEALKAAVTCLAVDKALTSGTVVDVAESWKRFGMIAR
ncbi:MAG: Gfo/Idh/MocA family oxidoreductase [Planctomycetaceae bacterium]|nr:Gfo/Idh/MocA family oxidoreductase [Planctomycetaceae bacterium]